VGKNLSVPEEKLNGHSVPKNCNEGAWVAGHVCKIKKKTVQHFGECVRAEGNSFKNGEVTSNEWKKKGFVHLGETSKGEYGI